MWWTERGNQVLRGPEWELFRAGLSDLWDWVEESFEEPGHYQTGVRAFDRLGPNPQLAMLALVGKALRDEAEPSPDLTMNTEATVAAVFRNILNQGEIEIEKGRGSEAAGDKAFWRKRVLDAHAMAEGEGEVPVDISAAGSDGGAEEDDEDPGDVGWTPPIATSGDLSDWEFLILDYLANRVLWSDNDFEVDDCFLDAEPELRKAMMEELGIDPDYYLDIAPDPTNEALREIRRTLGTICGRPEPPKSGTQPRLG